MAYKRKTYKRKAPKRKYSKYSRKYQKKLSLKRVIKQVIHKTAETKCIQRYNLGQGILPSNAANFVSNIIELGPGSTMLIGQGTGQGQRVGNKIQTVSHTFKGTICPAPWNATTHPDPRPMHIKMWVFYDKTDPIAAPNPIINGFYQNGDSVVGFANDLLDHVRPINTDRYCILATRMFKVGFSQYAGAATTTANQDAFQAYSNNDYKLSCNFSINLTKHQIKQIRFNDTNNEPTTRRMFCMWQPVDATGGTVSASSIPAVVQYAEDFRYKDL